MSGFEPSDKLGEGRGPDGGETLTGKGEALTGKGGILPGCDEGVSDSGQVLSGSGEALADDRGVLLSDAAARRAFDELRADPEYLWEYIDDCCLARAHKACAALRARGIACEKIRVDNAHGTWLGSFGLAVCKADAPGGFVFMGFHIAPLVRAHTPGGLVEYVFDPALCDGPARIEEWAGKLINRDSLGADGSVDPTMQDKDFTRLAHDVFEKVLYWENKDDAMSATLALLASHRQEYELKRRLRGVGGPGESGESGGYGRPGEPGKTNGNAEPGEPDAGKEQTCADST